jgi:hypothetical protein
VIVVLTGGERHEQPTLPALMEGGAVKRAGRGSPRTRPERVAGDKGYSILKVRRYLRGRRVAMRCEKRAANYLAMVTIAAILLWL